MHRPSRRPTVLVIALALTAAPLAQVVAAPLAGAASAVTYTPASPGVDTVENGPWTLSQGDPAAGAPYNRSLPTYTPGGTPTQSGGYPNLAVYPAAAAPVGTPYATGVAGTPGPVDAYCTGGGRPPSRAPRPPSRPTPRCPCRPTTSPS